MFELGFDAAHSWSKAVLSIAPIGVPAFRVPAPGKGQISAS